MLAVKHPGSFRPRSLIKRLTGFTLIELMVAIAIVSILLGIGFPIYAEYLRKARRADAQGALYAFANAMEQHAARQPNLGYANAAAGGDPNAGPPLAAIFPDESPLDGNEKYYDLTVSIVLDAGGYGGFYSLSAAPKGAQAGDDCGTLSLTSAGTRTVSTAEPNCWK